MKHGLYTADAISARREVNDLLRAFRGLEAGPREET